MIISIEPSELERRRYLSKIIEPDSCVQYDCIVNFLSSFIRCMWQKDAVFVFSGMRPIDRCCIIILLMLGHKVVIFQHNVQPVHELSLRTWAKIKSDWPKYRKWILNFMALKIIILILSFGRFLKSEWGSVKIFCVTQNFKHKAIYNFADYASNVETCECQMYSPLELGSEKLLETSPEKCDLFIVGEPFDSSYGLKYDRVIKAILCFAERNALNSIKYKNHPRETFRDELQHYYTDNVYVNATYTFVVGSNMQYINFQSRNIITINSEYEIIPRSGRMADFFETNIRLIDALREELDG